MGDENRAARAAAHRNGLADRLQYMIALTADVGRIEPAEFCRCLCQRCQLRRVRIDGRRIDEAGGISEIPGPHGQADLLLHGLNLQGRRRRRRFTHDGQAEGIVAHQKGVIDPLFLPVRRCEKRGTVLCRRHHLLQPFRRSRARRQRNAAVFAVRRRRIAAVAHELRRDALLEAVVAVAAEKDRVVAVRVGVEKARGDAESLRVEDLAGTLLELRRNLRDDPVPDADLSPVPRAARAVQQRAPGDLDIKHPGPPPLLSSRIPSVRE